MENGDKRIFNLSRPRDLAVENRSIVWVNGPDCASEGDGSF